MTCEQCGENTDKLVKFRSAQVCIDCQNQLESDEMFERRGYRPDCAQERIEISVVDVEEVDNGI